MDSKHWNKRFGWALAGCVAMAGCGSDSADGAAANPASPGVGANGNTNTNMATPGSVDPRTVNVGGDLTGVDAQVDTDMDGVPDVNEGTGDANMNNIPAHLDPNEQGSAPPAEDPGSMTDPGGNPTPVDPNTGEPVPVADGGAPTPTPPPADCEAGPTAGDSVLIIGDSYMGLALFPPKVFGGRLMENARNAGALADGDSYADRSVPGTQMAGGLQAIPQQYADENNGDGHVKTVVMTGGGNDVLVSNRSCIDDAAPPGNTACVATIDTAFDTAATLLQQMADDGVENVVYFFYPHLPGGGLGGDKELTRQTIDYALERTDGVSLPELCANAPVNCHFVDTRGLFPDDDSQFQDGVHPTDANTHKIADKVWETMQANCIAQ